VGPYDLFWRGGNEGGTTKVRKNSDNVADGANLCSSDVRLAAGIPLSISAIYSYSSTKNVGAILLTSAPITHERYFYATPFKKWVSQNASAIITTCPDVKDHDLWVVTSTFSTKKCAVNVWNSRGTSLKVGFTADIGEVGKAGASVNWFRSQTDGGWSEYSAQVS
jgi:hypothetical protein